MKFLFFLLLVSSFRNVLVTGFFRRIRNRLPAVEPDRIFDRFFPQPDVPFPTRRTTTLPIFSPKPKSYYHNIVAPKIFRVGATEKVILNLYNYNSATVNAFLTDLPRRSNVFSRIQNLQLNLLGIENPVELEFKVEADDIPRFLTNQKVELSIRVTQSGDDFSEVVEIDVSKQSGYLFIQTDRPIYRPNERVEIRVVPLEQDMSPERDNEVQITVKTPDGVGAYRSVQRLPQNGFSGTIFRIAENPTLGTWSVEAKYVSPGYDTVSTVDFVIRRYVLPTFNVNIDLDKNFFFPNDVNITGYIRAEYSYGEPVEGNYFLNMKLRKTPTSDPVSFYKRPGAGSFLNTAYFENGEQHFSIPLTQIQTVLNPGETLNTLADNSASIFIEATVNARADGVLESDISSDLPILKSPYSIDTSDTVIYYTPGLSYLFQAVIRDVTTGETVESIMAKITINNEVPRDVQSNANGMISLTYDTMSNSRANLNIVITTAIPNTADEDQATKIISVSPYVSPINRYLKISLPAEPARVGQNDYFVTFSFIPSAPNQIRYIIVARGVIITSGINTPISNNVESTEMISIRQTMVPYARIVAYYRVDDQIVSTSEWIEVVDRCKDELTVKVPAEVLPGANIQFDIRGAPNAVIGISGVDKAAFFLHQQDKLTRETMFKRMGDYDEGCVRSGGNNARNVFVGAGLQVQGLTSLNTPSPCGQSSLQRGKRNANNNTATTAKQLRQCQIDGARDNLAGISCAMRYNRCLENVEDLYPSCCSIFRIACESATRERLLKEAMGITGTGSEADAEASLERRRSAFQDEEEPITVTLVEGGEPITVIPDLSAARENAAEPRPALVPVRPPTDRFETAFSFEIQSNREVQQAPPRRPAQPAALPSTTSTTTTTTTTTTANPAVGLQRVDFNEALSWPTFNIGTNGRFQFTRRARDSITTFIIDAIGMQDSPDGFCIAPPAELRVFKDIFVQLNTPYSLKKQEQAELRIAIFNYNRQSSQEVVVQVKAEDVFCTRFRSDVFSEVVRMNIEAGGSGSTSITVFPLRIPPKKTGRIEVHLRNPKNILLDTVRKDILIEPEGQIEDTYQSYPLDLKNVASDSFQVSFSFPEQFVPDTRQCWIYAYTNFLGPSIEVDPNTKEPRDIKSIFRQPYGCGEQNMLVTGPNVYAHKYLEAVGKLLPGTLQYIQSVARIEDGFNRELRYRSDRVNRRAWAVFAHYPPSTWLNAFVDRVFIEAKMFYTDMDPDPVCNSLEWLLGEQEVDGHFRELRPPIHREMHGAVGGRFSLTAYVLITLADSAGFCSNELTQNIIMARTKAVAFLEQNKNNPTFQRPYGLALLTYALSLHDASSTFTREMNIRLLGLQQSADDNKQVFWRGHPANNLDGTDVHPYWYNRRPQAIDVEATSYALLAQVEIAQTKSRIEQSDIDLTRKIVRWLISQRNEAGAFISTQDTVVGLQALATYQIWIDQVDPPSSITSMNVTLTSSGDTSWSPPKEYKFYLDEASEGLRTEIPVPTDVMLNGNVGVNVIGSGEGVLSYRCIYRTTVDEDGCHFDLRHNVEIVNPATENGPPMTIKITITVSKPIGLQAEQSIIDVSLLTGFVPVESTLMDIAVADVVDGTVERYEVSNQNVIFYMNRIDSTPITFAFLMEQRIAVDNFQPGKITVYDYYEPSVRCSAFYALPGQATELRTASCDLQTDEVCRCAEGVCPLCRPRNQQLDNTTCIGGSISETCETCDDFRTCFNLVEKSCSSNYVYILNITSSPDIAPTTVFATFTATILEILKTGHDRISINDERTFLMRTDCYGLCRDQRLIDNVNSTNPGDYKFLRENTPILIIGTPPERSLDRNGQLQARYLLGEGTYMERIVPPSRCERVVRNLADRGCNRNDPNRTPKREADCIQLRKFNKVCITLNRLREYLREGCD